MLINAWYYDFKIIHVVTGSLMLGLGLTAVIRQFRQRHEPQAAQLATVRYQFRLAWAVITPLALFQALSAVFVIAARGYQLNQIWLDAAFLGYFCAGVAWFGCLLCLKTQVDCLTRLQASTLGIGGQNNHDQQAGPLEMSAPFLEGLLTKARYGQWVSGVIALLSLLVIIFFMSSASP